VKRQGREQEKGAFGLSSKEGAFVQITKKTFNRSIN
jgi:hypothetical protein